MPSTAANHLTAKTAARATVGIAVVHVLKLPVSDIGASTTRQDQLRIPDMACIKKGFPRSQFARRFSVVMRTAECSHPRRPDVRRTSINSPSISSPVSVSSVSSSSFKEIQQRSRGMSDRQHCKQEFHELEYHTG
jgi:hypothetical protein